MNGYFQERRRIGWIAAAGVTGLLGCGTPQAPRFGETGIEPGLPAGTAPASAAPVARFASASPAPTRIAIGADGAPAPGADIPAALYDAGLRALRDGRLDLAVRALQAAIKLRPESMRHHLALGVALHLQFLGGLDAADAAQTAYEVAARLDGRSALPLLQLGRLSWDRGRYRDARDAYLRAYARDTRRGDALEGVAAASWYTGDFTVARWAADESQRRGLDGAVFGRVRVLLAAVGGDGARLDAAIEDYATRWRPDPLELDALRRRGDELRETPLQIAQAAAEAPAGDRGPDGRTPDRAPPAARDDEDAADAKAGRRATPLARWFDCDREPGFFHMTEEQAAQAAQARGNNGNGSAGGDETEQLRAIPAPCPDGPQPRMVLLDTAIIRSQDLATTSYGVNLLGALSVYATGSRIFGSAAATADGATGTTGRSFSLNLGSSPAANYISYALDIANVFSSRNELLSRPTLIALDRLPSTFFSGAVVTLGIAGSANMGSTISDKPIGVSLSITPTVVDDDTVNLNVKVARAALTGSPIGASSTFSQSLATTRTQVQASVSVRFGETIVVSGLTENEETFSQSGVPVLKEIPLLQWLFDRQSSMRVRTSILVAITPRRGAEATDVAARLDAVVGDPLVRARLRSLVDALATRPATVVALERTASREFFQLTREGDLRGDAWARSGQPLPILEEPAPR
jgi:tetratricopeptide (TPR) repeat protein